LNENNEPIDSFTIWDSYWDIGSPNQQLVINYEIPINKIPFSFVKANYSYTGDYNWQKSSNAFSQLKDIGSGFR
jgi:cell surface protein SprA